RGTEDHGVARLDDDGAGGLLGQLAGLERDLFALDLDGDARNGVRHIQFPSAPPFGRRSPFLFYSFRTPLMVAAMRRPPRARARAFTLPGRADECRRQEWS